MLGVEVVLSSIVSVAISTKVSRKFVRALAIVGTSRAKVRPEQQDHHQLTAPAAATIRARSI